MQRYCVTGNVQLAKWYYSPSSITTNKYMKAFPIATAALFLMISVPSHAAKSTMFGYGATTCGQYLEEVKSAGRDASMAESWALGFISAMNVHVFIKDALDPTDAGGIKAAIRLHCEKNPLNRISVAANEVALELARRVGDTSSLVRGTKK